MAAMVKRFPSATAALRSGVTLCPYSSLKASSGTSIGASSPVEARVRIATRATRAARAPPRDNKGAPSLCESDATVAMVVVECRAR